MVLAAQPLEKWWGRTKWWVVYTLEPKWNIKSLLLHTIPNDYNRYFIVIPVFNQLQYTVLCVESLLASARINQSVDEYLGRKLVDHDGYLALLSQRLADLNRIGNIDLQVSIKSKRTEALLMRKVWTKNYHFVRLMSYSAKRALLSVFFKAWFREKKGRIFFPVKKMMHKLSTERP